uniref:Sad1 and UNC84 domain containing 1 n=1 Tax=Strix occidentalis caurina TaxID=311401 RepID=A0A8D0EXK9_STROC
MDFSRLHTYTPPQCLPENTGYTYALSSSYSSSALDFETENKIDPVFDSPRMSRRSLRLAAAGFNKSDDARNDRDSSYAGNTLMKQCKSMNKQSGSVRHVPRKNLSSSSIFSQSSFNSHASDASMVSTVLDESLIREQTEVDHFWGLDDEGDPKGSGTTVMQVNGDIATAETQTTMINGYTCSDCSMLSERKEVLTAYSPSHVPSSRIYSRDRSQKHTSSDDCKGKKHLEIYTTDHMQSSWAKRVARTIWHTFSYAGYFMLHVLRTVGATGWLVSQKVLSLLWLAILSPGRGASGMFRLLRTGWYQLVTLMSLLKVFLLRRCVSLEKTDTINIFDSGRINELEKQMAFVSDRCHHHDEAYSKVMLLLRNLQDQVAQMSDKSEIVKLIKNVMDDDEHNQLLSKVKKLELELSQMKSELLTEESVKTSCEKIDVIHEKVDAQVKESVKLMLFGDQQEDFPESLLQWLTSNFVSKSDLQTLLQDLELQILKNITLHMSVTNQKLTSEVVTNAVANAGISGITEAQAQIIVNNALKLYSQDKIGMVDFALESGGGSVLSTRCSETYETKTALISLFGIPLWYFSQSPRVVIQPDMYPGNCWAFKGSQGYLVVRLSMKIYPTAFTVEHIPKTLSPTGNITSAPRNFSVYGLDDEYQEEGKLLGQYIYDQGGEPLQMFPVMKSENAFQIVELRIFSNWGHAEYTCLYRFRVHGKPAE